MKNIAISMFILTIFFAGCTSKQNIWITFYNAQNLFDTKYDSHLMYNEEFTPGGKKKWNAVRKQDKQDRLAKVFFRMDNGRLPALIGLSEIENRPVIEDLLHSKKLQNHSYTIIHKDSPDERGIDCALLVDTNIFQILSRQAIPVHLKDDKTRDILETGLRHPVLGTLFVYVNHWPSRRSPSSSREKAAATLAERIKELQKLDPRANFLVMGDFNDEPSDPSLTYLESKSRLISYRAYMPQKLQRSLQEKSIGTYFYHKKKQWNFIDHIYVSRHLSATVSTAGIYHPEFLVNPDKKGTPYPYGTYNRDEYQGGASDHFPVFIVLQTKNK